MKKLLHGTALLLALFLLPLAAAAVTISETHTNVYCNGTSTGSIDISVSGGVTPYSYNWGDGATTQDRTALAAGNYIVTVTDNTGATNSLLINITESSAITTAAVVTGVYCGGGNTGAIDLTAIGGNGTYTYAWNDFFYTEDRTNLTAAVYYVTVTDFRGCTKVDSANVTQPPGMVITKTITNVTCGSGANGAIDLTVQFGFPVYTYLWNDGVTTQDRTAIAAGNYSVTVTDLSGCSVSATATVGQSGGGMAVNTTSVNPSCFGGANGTITVTSVVGSVGPYSFSWSDGPTTQNRTGMSAGSYTVTATSTTGCTAAATVNLTQPAVLAVTLTPIQLTCFGSSNGAINSAVTGGSTSYSYNWGGGVFTQNRTGLASGNFTVTVTDFRGCTATQTTFVPQPLQLTITATSSPQACIGGPTGSVTTSVVGGLGSYSYWWGSGIVSPNLNNVNAGTYSVTVTDGNGCTASATSTVLAYTPMVLTITQVNNACFGGAIGSVDLSVANGWSPFTYVWSNSPTTQDISSLAAGSYTVTVSDNHSCNATRTVSITQPSFPISINAIVSDVTCNGGNNGAINVSVSNGEAPYSYNWGVITTQNRTGLSMGNYPLTVTDNNGCSVSTSITVNQATLIVIIPTVTNTTCFGGSTGAINLAVTGGSAPYTYLWNNGAVTQNRTGLAAGNYPVTVTDNHTCTATATIAVGEPTAVTITPTVVNLSCNNISTGSISIAVAGGTSPYTYAWNDGQATQNRTGLAAGTYTVTATDNAGCAASNTSTVTQPTPIAFSSTNTNVSCNAESNGAINLSVTGGTSPYAFVWNGGAVTQNRTSLAAGTYAVTVADNNLCTASATIAITQPAAISLSTTTTNVACNGDSTGSIALTVSGGTSGYIFNWSNGVATQNNNNTPSGVYSVTVSDANTCSATVSATISQPTPIITSSAVVNTTCFGSGNGSIVLTVSGGGGGYTYLWSNGVNTQDIINMAAGSYSVTVKDVANCIVVTSATISQPTQLVVSSTSVNVLCNGANTGSVDLTVTGGNPSYTYNWSTGATTQDISSLYAQNYSVTVSDNNSCSATSTIAITQPAIITITETRQHVSCNGGSNGSINIIPSGGVATYTFDWGGGISTQNRTGLVAGNYFVTVTDLNACNASYGVAITQPTALSLNTAVTPVSCGGLANGAVDLTVNGGAGSYTYIWSNGFTTQDISSLAANTYNVTVKDAGNCTALASATVTQPTQIVVSSTQVNATCNGSDNGSIDVTVIGGSSSYSYLWSNGAVTQDVVALLAQNYIVTVTDNNACSATSTIAITQPLAIIASQTHTDVSCSGVNNGSIDLSVTGGSSPYTYSWSNGAVTQDLNSLVANTYRVTITDNAACAAVATPVTIVQGASITLSETHKPYACTNHAGAIDLTVIGGTAPYNFSWNGGIATEDRANLSPGNYSVVVTDANTCSATTSVAITQLAPLSTSINRTNVTCHGGNNGAIALFVQGGTAPYTFDWNQGANTSSLTSLIAANYRVLVVDSNNCNAIDSASITEPTAIQISKNVTDITCSGMANGTINVTVTGGTAGYTYYWNTTDTTKDISNLQRGNYELTVTDANFCAATSGNILVSEPQPLAMTSTITPISCSAHNDGAVQLQITGGAQPFTYGWSNSFFTSSINNLSAGNYDVTVTDNRGCTTNGTFTVGVTPPIAITPLVRNTACNTVQNGAIDLTVTGGSSAYSFDWNNGAITEDITGLSQGVYAVTVTDARNCSAQGSYGIATDYVLTVDATPSTTINLGEAVQLTAVTNVDHANTYTWLPAVSLVCGTCATTEATPMLTTFYTVNVVDANGCQATDTLTVTVNSITDIFIPNAFTPNNDGNNDALQLFGDLSAVAYLDFMVFNRWGEKVFESSNANFAWDGTYKGELVPQGVYIYTAKMVFINGYSRPDMKGSLTVIR